MLKLNLKRVTALFALCIGLAGSGWAQTPGARDPHAIPSKAARAQEAGVVLLPNGQVVAPAATTATGPTRPVNVSTEAYNNATPERRAIMDANPSLFIISDGITEITQAVFLAATPERQQYILGHPELYRVLPRVAVRPISTRPQ